MSASSDPGGDTGAGPGRGPTPGTPRWVKVSGTVGAILILLFVALLLTGLGGEHGPGRHTSSRSGPAAQVPPLIVPDTGDRLSATAGRQSR